MLACVAERPLEERLELGVLLPVKTAEDVDVVLWELERCRLEAERAGRVGEEEAKVDV